MGIKLSFIITLYNKEAKIASCLESLIKLKYNEVEFIVVDDGSTDNSVNIVNSFMKQDSRINLSLCNHNGVSYARNIGLTKSSGDYLTFVDSNDYINSENYDNFIKEFNDENDLIIFGFNIDDNKEIIFEEKILDKIELLKELAFNQFDKNILNPVSNKIYKRKIILENNVKFNETYNYNEDMIFNLIYLQFARIIRFKPDILYNHVVNLDQNQVYFSDLAQNTKTTLDAIMCLYEMNDLSTLYLKELNAYILNRLQIVFYNRKEYLKDEKEYIAKINEDRIVLNDYLSRFNNI